MTLNGVSKEQDGEGGIMRGSMIGTPVYTVYWGGQLKEYEMRAACGTYGGRNMLTIFCWGKLRGRMLLNNLGTDDKAILKCGKL